MWWGVVLKASILEYLSLDGGSKNTAILGKSGDSEEAVCVCERESELQW